MPKTGAVPAATAAAQRLALQMGYDFVDAELTKENGSAFLRIYIDHTGGLTLERLEAFHRALLPYVENLAYDYLEVSSPGLDRPIRRARDFERGKGKKVEVRLYRSIGKQKVFEGTLIGLIDDLVVIQTESGEMRFPRTDCALVKPVVDFTQQKEDQV